MLIFSTQMKYRELWVRRALTPGFPLWSQMWLAVAHTLISLAFLPQRGAGCMDPAPTPPKRDAVQCSGQGLWNWADWFEPWICR